LLSGALANAESYPLHHRVFVATYFIRRYLDGMDIPKTMTRGIVVFVLALAVAYGVAFLVELF